MHAYRRIEMLIDEGTLKSGIRRGFSQSACIGHEGKVEAAREKTELNEAVVTGKGKIHGYEIRIAVCDLFSDEQMGHNMGRRLPVR